MLAQRFCCTPGEICFISRQRPIVAPQVDRRAIRYFEGEIILKTDRLQDRIDFVVTVHALAMDLQAPIDFGEGRDADLGLRQDSLDSGLVRLALRAGQVPRLNGCYSSR